MEINPELGIFGSAPRLEPTRRKARRSLRALWRLVLLRYFPHHSLTHSAALSFYTYNA